MHDQAEKLRQMVQEFSNQSPKPLQQQHQQAPKTRVITVTSGKGGVGKTNFTVNLALAFSALGQKVLLIDADLGMANVDVILGTSSQYSVLHLLQDGIGLQDILTEGPRGIKFMSGGSGISQLSNLSPTELQHIVTQIAVCDKWADIVLIDTGAGLSRNVMNFVMAADEVIVITTPEPTAMTDAYAMIKAFASHAGTASLKLVINRVNEFDEGKLVADKLLNVTKRFLGISITYLGVIYEDRNLIGAVKNQVPLLIYSPQTISSRCIEQIAQRLLHKEIVHQPKGIKGFFNKFFEILS